MDDGTITIDYDIIIDDITLTINYGSFSSCFSDSPSTGASASGSGNTGVSNSGSTSDSGSASINGSDSAGDIARGSVVEIVKILSESGSSEGQYENDVDTHH
jgi:hypothetical protein